MIRRWLNNCDCDRARTWAGSSPGPYVGRVVAGRVRGQGRRRARTWAGSSPGPYVGRVVARMSQQGGPKITRRGTFLNTMLNVCSNRHEKSCLRGVGNLWHACHNWHGRQWLMARRSSRVFHSNFGMIHTEDILILTDVLKKRMLFEH